MKLRKWGFWKTKELETTCLVSSCCNMRKWREKRFHFLSDRNVPNLHYLDFFSNQENVKRMFIRDSVWDAMVFRALMHPSPYCCTYFNADSDNGQLLIHVMMPKAFLSFTFSCDALHYLLTLSMTKQSLKFFIYLSLW